MALFSNNAKPQWQQFKNKQRIKRLWLSTWRVGPINTKQTNAQYQIVFCQHIERRPHCAGDRVWLVLLTRTCWSLPRTHANSHLRGHRPSMCREISLEMCACVVRSLHTLTIRRRMIKNVIIIREIQRCASCIMSLYRQEHQDEQFQSTRIFGPGTTRVKVHGNCSDIPFFFLARMTGG